MQSFFVLLICMFTAEWSTDSLISLVYDEMNGDYYRYYGSLTTPGCNEVVQWTIFTTPIPISAKQVCAGACNK